MDELGLLTLIIAVGTIALVYFSVLSWRSDRKQQRLARSKAIHTEYLELSRVIQVIRDPSYLRDDFHDLAVALPSWAIHIREREIQAIDIIVRPDNPDIEPRTRETWNQVMSSRTRMTYPSSTVVFEVNKVAFDNFEAEIRKALETAASILREDA